MNTYNTGVKLYNYEITLTPKPGGVGVGVKKVVTVDNLPHSSHEEFQQKLFDALLNAGIGTAQMIITHKLK